MGLKDTIKEALIEMEKEKKIEEKRFKYPFGKRVGKSQRRKNYLTAIVVNENGTCDFKKYQIKDQTIMHDDIPRLAAAGYVMFDRKGNPLMILPNWSVEPFSPLENYNKSLINGSNTTGYRLLLDRMENSKTEQKKTMGGALKWIIGIVILGIILFAVLSGGGA